MRAARRVALTLACLAFGIGGISVPLAQAQRAPNASTSVWLLHRTTSGPSSFTATFSVTSDGAHEAWAANVPIRWSTPTHLLTLADQAGVLDLRDQTVPSLYTGGVGSASCATAGAALCTVGNPHQDSQVFFAGEYKSGGAYPTPTDQYLIVSGLSPRLVSLDAKGWRLQRTKVSVLRRSDSDSQARGVETQDGAGLGEFQSVSANGGRHGSLVLAVPPCSSPPAGTTAVLGYGSYALDDGRSRTTGTCSDGHDYLASYASRMTTWTFAGLAAGYHAGDTRLVVVSF